MDRRLSKKLSTNEKTTYEEFLYQGDREIGVLSDQEIVELRILGRSKGADMGAAVALELAGVMYAPLHDHQGSIVALLDAETGVLVENAHYSAFGESADISRSPWRFASKRLDSETGLYLFQKRYYSSSKGCFITPDPLQFADGPHLYAYVHNNPLICYDPYGLFSWKDGDGNEMGIWSRAALTAQETFFNPRFQGALQAFGGLAEAGVGAGATYATAGMGAAVGFPLMAHGLDQFFTGLHTAVTGTHKISATEYGLQSIGFSAQNASLINSSIGIFGTMGGSAIIKGSQVAALSKFYTPANYVSPGPIIEPILFGQRTVGQFFSKKGNFASQPLVKVVQGLKNGSISPEAVPIEVIVRNGQKVTLNNRSLLVLRRARIEPKIVIDKTGDLELEQELNKHLRGYLPSDVIKIRGGPPGTSWIGSLE